MYNLGERVEAYTSALWIAILTACAAPLRPVLGERVPLEWMSVLLGLAASVAGLAFAQRGALRLARAAGRRGLAVPLGAIAFAALPPAWSFVTSGLETGLSFLWLGLCFWAAARDDRRPAHAAVIGLGPLVRPDLAIYSAGFLALLLARAAPAPGPRIKRIAALAASAAALPVAYQIFRMGYFAALVPNTAIAKEASAARWDQGLIYLRDFAGPYRIWIPLAAALLAVGAAARRRPALALIPAACAAAHAAYVTRVGGDFMHARMLLPAWFAILMPCSVIAVDRRRRARVISLLPALVIIPWALVCAAALRVPYIGPGKEGLGPQGIADERYYYSERLRLRFPISLWDYRRYGWVEDGRKLAAIAQDRRALLPWRPAAEKIKGHTREMELSPRVPSRVVAVFSHVGLLGYAAGTRVHVVDRLGLADAVAARLALKRRGRPGHEKNLPDEWVVARFAAAADAPPGPGSPPLEPKVRDARAAIGCGDLALLLAAITEPLTARRFLDNLALAPRLHALRVPPDPTAARAALCGKPR